MKIRRGSSGASQKISASWQSLHGQKGSGKGMSYFGLKEDLCVFVKSQFALVW